MLAVRLAQLFCSDDRTGRAAGHTQYLTSKATTPYNIACFATGNDDYNAGTNVMSVEGPDYAGFTFYFYTEESGTNGQMIGEMTAVDGQVGVRRSVLRHALFEGGN